MFEVHRSKVLRVAAVLVLAGMAVALLLMPSDTERVSVASRARPIPRTVVSLPPAAPLTARLPAKGDLRLLFVGDSLRAGFYATKKARSYPELVRREVAAGRGSVTVLDATRIVATGDGFRRAASIKAVPGGAHLAVLQIGTNDVNKTPLARFRKHYRRLVGMVRAGSPEAELLCLGVWQKGPPLEPFRGPYNNVIASECRDGLYVDITALALNRGFHGPQDRPTFAGPSDLFHPNDAGHRAIAGAVLAHLR